MNTKRILELAEGTTPATADAFLCVQDTDSTPVTRRLTFAVLLTLFSTLNKGTWSGVTSYAKGEIVERNGASYQCILASLNNAPPNATYWRLIADKGATGAAGSTWHSGTGAPAAELGSDGDYYFRTSNSDIYKKAAGTWSIIANIEGATGDSVEWIVDAGAPDNGVGEDGDMYLNSSNGDVYGPKASGAWPGSPSANIKGPQGDPGAPGTGDVNGPASAVDERIAVFDGTTGKLIKDGGKTVAELQPADATLTALAAVVTATDKLIYATAEDAFATTTLTAFARTILDDADASAARATLGLGTMATAAAADYLPLAGGTMTASILLPAGSVSAPVLALADSSNSGFFKVGTATWGIASGGAGVMAWGPYGGPQITRDAPLSWNSVAGLNSISDVFLWRDAAGALALHDATNSQTIRVYGTRADASNYVRASLAANSTTVTLAAQAAGGLGDIKINLTPAGSEGVYVTANFLDVPQIRVDGSVVFDTSGSTLNVGNLGGFSSFVVGLNDVFLRIGGTTSSFPALKRSSAELHVRLADDSAFSSLKLSSLHLDGQAARVTEMARHTTADTAGNTLTVQAGGATVGATNKAGGYLDLIGGIATGTGASGVRLKGYAAGASGTADNTASTVIEVLGNKLGFFGVTPVVQQAALTATLTTLTHTAPVTPDYAIAALTDTGGFGFATADEGHTVLSVIANLQARVNELETILSNLGITP